MSDDESLQTPVFTYTGPIKPYKAVQKRLEQELRLVRAELQVLQRRNSFLRVSDSILTAFDLDLQWLREHAAAAAASGQSTLAHAFRHQATTEESQLLQQLQELSTDSAAGSNAHAAGGNTRHGSRCASSNAGLTRSTSSNSSDPDQLLVAPDDPLFLFRHVCSLPPYPGAAELTVEQLAEDYSATVHTLALQLQLYRAEQQLPTPASVASALGTQGAKTPLQKMQDALCRTQWIRGTLALTGRSNLLRAHYISSCEDTSQHLSEPSRQQQVAALSLLGLSQRQHQRLADGYVVFQGLLKPVIQEMQQQQQPRQQQHNLDDISSSSLHGSGSGNANGSSSSDNRATRAAAAPAANGAAAAGTAHEAYKHQLCKQQDFTRRMTALLNTDMRIRLAVVAYVLGSFTWLQLAELHVLTWPYSPNATVLCEAAVAHLGAQQQQQ